jgi:hypothetical protein
VSGAAAGHAFLVRLFVRRSDSQKPLDAGTVACAATLAGQPLHLIERTGPRDGVSVCRWLLPTSARGKQLNGTITDTFQGASISRAFHRSVT